MSTNNIYFREELRKTLTWIITIYLTCKLNGLDFFNQIQWGINLMVSSLTEELSKTRQKRSLVLDIYFWRTNNRGATSKEILPHIIWETQRPKSATYGCYGPITKTYLYHFDPLKPHFYIVKLGFTGVYIIFLISAQKHRLWYSLEPPRRGGSNEYPQSMFWAEIWKISAFFSENFHFLVVKFSVYLNRRVFLMYIGNSSAQVDLTNTNLSPALWNDGQDYTTTWSDLQIS